MKTLDKSGKRMIIKEIKNILASNEVLPTDRHTGACTPGAPDSTAFRSNRSRSARAIDNAVERKNSPALGVAQNG